jgi:hypothetical protein
MTLKYAGKIPEIFHFLFAMKLVRCVFHFNYVCSNPDEAGGEGLFALFYAQLTVSYESERKNFILYGLRIQHSVS